MKKYFKTKLFACVGMFLLMTHAARAGLFTDDTAQKIRDRGDQFGQGAGFASGQEPGETIAFLIEAFLGLLGIIFIIIIIVGGFRWMTAGGEEEKVRKSKTMMTRAVIGLIIVLCAYAITYFVFSHLPMGE
jgi:amino acid transporter